MKIRLIPCLCSAAALLGGGAVADPNLQWRVYGDLGTAYATNPTKVNDDNAEPDTIVRARIGGALTQQTATTDLDFDYRYTHDTWLDDSFGDRDTLEGYGIFTWQPKDYFQFFVNNRRRDLIVNNTFADTQNNRSVRSVTELGALFTARLGPVDSLNLAPVYRLVNYNSGEGIDSKRPGLVAFWEHRLSPTDNMSVNFFAERIDFETDAVQNDIDRAQAFLGYAARLNHLRYDFEAGYTWVKVDDANPPANESDQGTDFSGPLLRALVQYQQKNHIFNFIAVRDLTDTSIGLDDSEFGSEYTSGDTDVNQLALVTRTQVDAFYDLTFAAEQWNLRAGYRYDKQDVEATATEISLARDEIRNWLYGSLDYDMTRKITARLVGSYKNIDFTDSPFDRVDDEYRLGFMFVFQIFKYGYVQTGALHEARTSNVSFVSDYTDNMLFVNFRWVFPEYQLDRDGRRGAVGEEFGRDFDF
jgi:hypothetical protein